MLKIFKLLFIEPFIVFFKILKNPFSIFKNFPLFGFLKLANEYDQSMLEMHSKVESMIRNGEQVPNSSLLEDLKSSQKILNDCLFRTFNKF
jgi:hypothetical protein